MRPTLAAKKKEIVFKPAVTVFYCANSIDPDQEKTLENFMQADTDLVSLACSSMIKDIFILKAFEAGADAVAVITCPVGKCQFIDGNLRALKRINRVKTMLDDTGIGAGRLDLIRAEPSGTGTISRVEQFVSGIEKLGLSPAR